VVHTKIIPIEEEDALLEYFKNMHMEGIGMFCCGIFVYSNHDYKP
jgi:hypothetical protein